MDRTALFRTQLAEGNYMITQGSITSKLTVLPGRTYSVDLRPDHSLTFATSNEQKRGSNEVTIRMTAHGAGAHQFEIRAYNLKVPELTRHLDLKGVATIEWHCRMQDHESPWVAVIVPDGMLNDKQELTGVEQ
jgi:hypothetical protein